MTIYNYQWMHPRQQLIFDQATGDLVGLKNPHANGLDLIPSIAAITSGTINGAVIGGTNPASGTFTNLTSTNSLTLSGNTITLSANNTMTRAIGTAASGATQGFVHSTTFSGNADGTSDVRGIVDINRVSGSNNIAQSNVRSTQHELTHDAGKTVTFAYADQSFIRLGLAGSVAGDITSARGFEFHFANESTGGTIGTAIAFYAQDVDLLDGTGTFGDVWGFRSGNMGHATRVTSTAISFDAADSTAGAPLTAAYRSQMSSGTNKWGIYASGTADNAFNGNLRIGSVVAPTVALDVTGSAIISGAFTANGNVTIGDAAGDSLTVNAGVWTLGSNVVATRAFGVAAAGASIALEYDTTFSGDAGGTTDIRHMIMKTTASGSNSIAQMILRNGRVEVSSTAGTVTNVYGDQLYIRNNSGAAITNAFVVETQIVNSGTADISNSAAFRVASIGLSSGTGNIATTRGLQIGDLGHATRVTTAAYGVDISDFTGGAPISAAFRSAMTSGTGKYGFYADGTAANAFASDLTVYNTTAVPAGGSAGKGYKFSSATNFGMFFGSGAPTLSAAKGSLYLRSDGTTTNDRAYINTDGATTWTAITTVA